MRREPCALAASSTTAPICQRRTAGSLLHAAALLRRFLCGSAQAVALVFIYGLVTMQWLGLFLSTILIIDKDMPVWKEIIVLPFMMW